MSVVYEIFTICRIPSFLQKLMGYKNKARLIVKRV